MPSGQRLNHKNFFASYYHSSGVLAQELTPADVFEREAVLGRFGSKVNAERSLTVLDVGCGYGRYARALLERGYFYIGIDPVAENIERLERELQDLGYIRASHFELYSGLLGDHVSSTLEGRCDLALSINVIHHTPSAKIYLRDLFACIKHEGTVVIVEPNPLNVFHWASYALQNSITEEWKFLIFNPIYLLKIIKRFGPVGFNSLGPAPLRLINFSENIAKFFRFWNRHIWTPFDPFFRYEVKVYKS